MNSTPEETVDTADSFTGVKLGRTVMIHISMLLWIIYQCLQSLLYDEVGLVLLYCLLNSGVTILLTVLLHEFAKAIVAWKLGARVDRIVLWCGGGLTCFGPDDQGAKGDLKVAIVGPLIHLPILAFLAVSYIAFSPDEIPPLNNWTILLDDLKQSMILTLVRAAFWLNVLVAVANLFIPIYPLDGVRIWVAILRISGVDLTRTAKIVSSSGIILSVALVVYGMAKIFHIFVVGGLIEVLLGGFGFIVSKTLYDLTTAGRLKEDIVFGRKCYEEQAAEIEAVTVAVPPETGTSRGQESTSGVNMETVEIV
jgi:Zn-dependent protease